MTSRTRKIIEEALALPKDELVSVVDELQQNVEATDSPEEIEQAWRAELVLRLRSIKDGTAVMVYGAEVDRQLSKILEE